MDIVHDAHEGAIKGFREHLRVIATAHEMLRKAGIEDPYNGCEDVLKRLGLTPVR